VRIGILAVQGDAQEHEYSIKVAAKTLGISVDVVHVKKPRDLAELDGLIITGGESTAIAALASRNGLLDAIRDRIIGGLPVYGTCAGAILLAKRVRDATVGETRQRTLALMDIEVVRNAFGRQKDSFETELDVEGVGRVRAVFIRAPIIASVGPGVRVLAKVKHPAVGEAIAVAEQGHMLASIFHDELSDHKLHTYFLSRIRR